jgi:DNA-binding GntR family transcriptional regulator
VWLPAPREIRDRYEIREALESQAARLFAQRASASDRIGLQKMADHLDAMFNRRPGASRTIERRSQEFVHGFVQAISLRSQA